MMHFYCYHSRSTAPHTYKTYIFKKGLIDNWKFKAMFVKHVRDT